MKPLDPRLLKYAQSARVFLVVGAVLGLIQTVAMIGLAWLIALVITAAMGGSEFATLVPAIAGVAGFAALRGLAQWGTEIAGARAAAAAKTQLRSRTLRAIGEHPPALGTRSRAEVTTLVTHGLDALDPYFGKFLPQLLLTMIAMPILIAVTWTQDPVSAITEVLTVPVIPLFMVLIGLVTVGVQRRQLDSLTTLADSFLELVEGLSTLKIFGRARRQRERLEQITGDFRVSTMKVLRVSFLSGFALELFASLSVALVAVQIGIRLINDEMTLMVGLFALILAPEVFAPLRQVGAQFHNASEGVAASQHVFTLLEAADAAAADDEARAAADSVELSASAERSEHSELADGLRLDSVCVAYDRRPVLREFKAEFPRGVVTVLTGESGSGKSTLFGFIRGTIAGSGARTLDGARLSSADAARSIAWMGQRPGLLQGTVRENVALGQPDLDDALIRASLDLAGLDWLPLDRELGVGGSGLSGGQAQRVSLARTIARARHLDCPIVLCDEPTSALDAEREATVRDALRTLAREGRVVVAISHRRALMDAADRLVELHPAPEVAR